MGSIGTFGSFTQARLAIYASQLGISVTGNNISNVNTVGYTRQRLEQVSFKTGGADRYHSQFELRIGNGVLPTSVSQLRDPYLDIRFRNDNSNVGAMDGKLSGLEKIKAILDEVGKGGEVKEGEEFGIIAYQIENIFKALSSLTDYTGQKEYDVQVRTAVDSLCQELRSYASQLKELYSDTKDHFNTNIDTVNKLLTNIRDLNASIRKSEIHGDNALELRDQRNNLIDELSTYIKIDVTYTTEDIGAGQTVEKLIIKLGDANPDPKVNTDESVLIDGRYCAQLGYTQVPKVREEDPNDNSTFAYVKPDGTFTNDPKEANQVPDPQDPTVMIPEANPGYLPYEDADGNPTADPDQAVLVDNPNYNLTLSEMRDVYGKLHESVRVLQERVLDDGVQADKDIIDKFLKGETISEQLADGSIKITTVRRTWQKSLVTNPQYDPAITDPTDPRSFKYLKTVKDANGQNTQVGTNSAAEADRETKAVYYAQDYIKTPSQPVDLDDNDLYGYLQSQRELLTESGEFSDLDVVAGVDENAATKRGIPYYQNVLDLLAKQIATSFNAQNQGYLVDPSGNYITEGVNDKGEPIGEPITIDYTDANGDQKTYTLNKNDTWDDIPTEVKDILTAQNCSSVEDYLKAGKLDDQGNPVVDKDGNPVPNGIFRGGNLFSCNGDTDSAEGITAANISVSASWSRGPMVVNSFICPPGSLEPASTDSSNVLLLQGLENMRLDYMPTDISPNAQDKPMFTGSFSEMWRSIGTTLGHDQKETSTLLDNYYEKTVELDTSRSNVSSVDFNDEAMNLMQYSKSYNAACRLMTTLDSVLDKLINNTGMTT
ncbi:MAG: hypothetical protein HFG09_00995 [Oscillibacter sp.]|nr:hypothetical protein [Oscillibacter sp.]